MCLCVRAKHFENKLLIIYYYNKLKHYKCTCVGTQRYTCKKSLKITHVIFPHSLNGFILSAAAAAAATCTDANGSKVTDGLHIDIHGQSNLWDLGLCSSVCEGNDCDQNDVMVGIGGIVMALLTQYYPHIANYVIICHWGTTVNYCKYQPIFTTYSCLHNFSFL